MVLPGRLWLGTSATFVILDVAGFGFKPSRELRDDKLLIQRPGAGKYIERGELELRPSMERDMALGDDDDAAQAVRAELMKNVRHIGSASTGDGVDKGFPDTLCVGKPCGIAVVKIYQRVPGECHG